jgi:hypothetical protein
MALWILRTRDRSWMLLACALLFMYIPRSSYAYPKMEEGMAVKVSSSYSILQNKFERIIVYTDEPLHYDSVYRIIGKKQKIKRENGFFRFDYAEWAASQGVKYTVGSDQISIIRDTVSFRGLLQDQIERRTDTETVELMEKILLNISPSKDNADRWFYSNGFFLCWCSRND